ncbi:GNAT family N-acetyltransferase [Rossellomorea sp. SC111]|uniref:GNAT family N-acetyltransferase n=1 Tax=Rossellomorea sp. SC111 TaxID=2968985 RepID=UPI00215A48B6|nr:GNAT family N-acetyltransferase [Rossellomorea sp. SC111]MCR8847970.1 GNAT family N-acetyltransferase [Rossellomorea sp. SC111]
MVYIDEMKPDDWDQVAKIYHEGIATGNATFQNDIPSWEEWDANHIQAGRIVIRLGDSIVGWAAMSPVSSRCVYRGVAEVSVYVSARCAGQGIGSQLLGALIEASEQEGFWTLQSGIFPENRASIKLHEKHGFRIIGHREKIGKMDGVWRDTVLLERRSKIVGIK